MLKVLITFKVTEGVERIHTRLCEMEQTEYGQLKADFLAYVNGEAEAQRGASYGFLEGASQQPREMILRFDEVLYIECIAPKGERGTGSNNHAAAHSITGPLESAGAHSSTGPLSTRISGPTDGEG